MATARQTCEIMDGVLRLPSGSARHAADFLRASGGIPSTPGRPEQISATDTASILLSILLDVRCVADSSSIVDAYMRMRPTVGGKSFGETLAAYIVQPNDLLEIRLDLLQPRAVLTYRGYDGGVRALVFEAETAGPRLAFAREALIGPSPFIELAAAIKSAPEVRIGRRPTARHQAYERATRF